MEPVVFERKNMEIASAISSMNAAQLRDKINYAVAAKALDAVRDQGKMALELLEGAAEISDSTPSASTSQDLLYNLGQNLDVQA
jgi:hypothetical protein